MFCLVFLSTFNMVMKKNMCHRIYGFPFKFLSNLLLKVDYKTTWYVLLGLFYHKGFFAMVNMKSSYLKGGADIRKVENRLQAPFKKLKCPHIF